MEKELPLNSEHVVMLNKDNKNLNVSQHPHWILKFNEGPGILYKNLIHLKE